MLIHPVAERAEPGLSCVEGDVRLYNGGSPLEGRVQMCYNNIWIKVCGGFSWDSCNTNATCKQLGYLISPSTGILYILTLLCRL